MKISKYNYVVEYKGYHLLYNGLYSTCVILTESEYHDFENYHLNTDYESKMKEMGFYIIGDYDETDVVLYRSRKLVNDDRQQFYRIYTTTACNARCPYCYERSMPVQSLNKDGADRVCSYIEARMYCNTKVGIEWFGGEPLLNERAITYISDRIISQCSNNGVKYWSRMVSNGYLITPTIINKMKDDWRIGQIQITLDGLKNTYEKIKGYEKPDAFYRVINNILMLLEANIKVVVRLNYSSSNFNEILELIDYLASIFKNQPRLKIYCARIMELDMDNSRIASEDSDIQILERLKKNNLISNMIDTIQRRDNTCVAHMLNSFMILPDGRIGKCSQAMAVEDYVGSVSKGIDDSKMAKWCSPRLPKKCLECSLLPICNGGCIFERNLGKPFCFSSYKVLEYKLLSFLKEYVDDSKMKKKCKS